MSWNGRRWARRVRTVVGGVVIAWMILLVVVAVAGRADHRAPSNAIVVLGAAQYAGRPSPVLKARLDHAEELWRSGWAPFVLLAGGVGTRDTISEAEAGRRYLVGRGIPDSVIVLEPHGRTTAQSFRGVEALFAQRGWSRAILVSDRFHALRLRALVLHSSFEAVVSPTATSPIAARWGQEWKYFVTESVKLPIAALGLSR